ncbi:7406_t:CDS:2, partial [Funneliformis geosporum]
HVSIPEEISPVSSMRKDEIIADLPALPYISEIEVLDSINDIDTKALAYAWKREEGLHLDEYNKELGLAFEYSGNQYYQIVPFFHLQRQMNLDAQIWRD